MDMSGFKPYYVYRMLRARLGGRNPLSAVLKITSDCNLGCSHCPWEKGWADGIPKEEWFDKIDRVKKMGCVLCIIEGGEPFLREDLGEIVGHVRRRGMFAAVITNGTFDFSGLGADAVWVSIDGAGKVHDSIRGRGVFRKVMSNLEECRDRAPGKNVVSLTTISRQNVDDIDNICRRVSPMVKGMWFNFMYPYRGLGGLALRRGERRRAAERIAVLKGRYNIINSDSFLSSVGRDWKCRPWITVNVDSRGREHHGCTVEQLEPCRCAECDMSCYGELSMAYALRTDAIAFLRKSLGLESERLLWIKKASSS